MAYKKTPKRPKASIRLDPINPGLFLKLNVQFACEQCTHFAPKLNSCTLGYPTAPHLMESNLKCYEITGKMALCRFMEID